MTENDYILATELARILDADRILRDVMPSARVPEAEYHQVMATLLRWREATFEAIQKRRDETDDAAAAKEIPMILQDLKVLKGKRIVDVEWTVLQRSLLDPPLPDVRLLRFVLDDGSKVLCVADTDITLTQQAPDYGWLAKKEPTP